MAELSSKDNIQNYIQDKKVLYQKLHEYIDQSSDDIEEKYQSLFQVINAQKIKENKYDLLIFLNLIVKISNNFNRYPTFFDRITKILIELKEDIRQTYTNQEIFNIFVSNKVLLLFLFKEEMITMEKSIMDIMESTKYRGKYYLLYFSPEIVKFDNNFKTADLYTKDPILFEENRKKGENTDEIAELIRKDLIDEFISYVNQKDYQLNSIIQFSFFESNSFLLKYGITLIEYASFFGSTQIFKYLYKNGVDLTPSLWIYAIHSDNAELISILEENHIKPKDESYIECFYESIKCHHNEMALYIMNNLIKEKSQTKNEELFFKYYNFQFIELDEIETTNLFYVSFRYNHVYIIENLLTKSNFDVNVKMEKLSVFKDFIRGDMNVKTVKTALFFAIEKGFIDIVKFLLTIENIDVNIPERSFSIEKKYTDDVNEEKDDKNYRRFYCSNTPLTLSIEKNYTEITKLLLSHPTINVNSKHIIKDRNSDNMDIKSALIIAIENNDLEIVKLLLKNPKIDVNARYIKKFRYDDQYEEKTTLCVAIKNENIEIIKELLSSENIDINSEQLINIKYPYDEQEKPVIKDIRSALTLAIDQQNIDIVNLLISHPKICINKQYSTYVEYMSKMSSWVEYKMGGSWFYIMPLIYELINNPGRDFHLKKKEVIPALCYAIDKEQFDIAKVILSSKKDLDVNAEIKRTQYTFKNCEDNFGSDNLIWSPCAKSRIDALCIAVEKNNVDIIKLLLSSPNIDVNADKLEESYNYIRKEKEEEEEEEDNNNDNTKEVEWIHEKNIRSPLHIAVMNSNEEIIKYLLKNKDIDLNKVDDQNKKAIEYAANGEIKNIFQELG